MSAFIRLQDIKVNYDSKVVLQDVNFQVAHGETVALLGVSGSGKSTVLRLIIGLQEPSAGGIFFAERDVQEYSKVELARLRRRMSMVFQYSALFDFLSVKENIAFGLRQHTNLAEDIIDDQVGTLMEMIGLTGKGDLMPNEISGGMKKRVSLARAVATKPDILLYDEPTAGLDPIMSRTINRLMLHVQKNYNTTSIVVTHDIESALMVADRVIMIDDGRIAVDCSADDIFQIENKVLKNFISGWDAGRVAASREVLLHEAQ